MARLKSWYPCLYPGHHTMKVCALAVLLFASAISCSTVNKNVNNGVQHPKVDLIPQLIRAYETAVERKEIEEASLPQSNGEALMKLYNSAKDIFPNFLYLADPNKRLSDMMTSYVKEKYPKDNKSRLETLYNALLKDETVVEKAFSKTLEEVRTSKASIFDAAMVNFYNDNNDSNSDIDSDDYSSYFLKVTRQSSEMLSSVGIVKPDFDISKILLKALGAGNKKVSDSESNKIFLTPGFNIKTLKTRLEKMNDELMINILEQMESANGNAITREQIERVVSNLLQDESVSLMDFIESLRDELQSLLLPSEQQSSSPDVEILVTNKTGDEIITKKTEIIDLVNNEDITKNTEIIDLVNNEDITKNTEIIEIVNNDNDSNSDTEIINNEAITKNPEIINITNNENNTNNNINKASSDNKNISFQMSDKEMRLLTNYGATLLGSIKAEFPMTEILIEVLDIKKTSQLDVNSNSKPISLTNESEIEMVKSEIESKKSQLASKILERVILVNNTMTKEKLEEIISKVLNSKKYSTLRKFIMEVNYQLRLLCKPKKNIIRIN